MNARRFRVPGRLSAPTITSDPRARRAATHALTVSTILALGGVARAEPQSPEERTREREARAALAEAHELGKRGDFEAACVLFERSAEQAPSAEALLNLGICREYRADLVGALELFERALQLSQSSRQESAIKPRIEALLPRIPSVAIAPPPTPGTVVDVDARPVERFGVPLRLNPGEHQLRAATAHSRPHEETFSLSEGQALTLRIPELPPERPPSVPRPVPTQSTLPSGVSDKPMNAEPARAWQKPLVYGGIGLFVAGGAFSAWQFISMAQARSRKHDLAEEYECNLGGQRPVSAECDAGVRGRIEAIYYDEEEPARKRAWVGVAVSGVGASAALIGYFALPRAQRRDTASPRSAASPSLALRLRPELQLGPDLYAAELHGSW